jgi:hypothetical protein
MTCVLACSFVERARDLRQRMQQFSCEEAYDLGAQLLELGIIAKAEINHGDLFF